MKLYVGNLSYNTSEDDLRDAFSPYGEVVSAKIITDRDSGRSKGFGFVEFSNDEQAKQALSLNGTDFGGRALTVIEARPKTEGGGGGGRGGSRYCEPSLSERVEAGHLPRLFLSWACSPIFRRPSPPRSIPGSSPPPSARNARRDRPRGTSPRAR